MPERRKTWPLTPRAAAVPGIGTVALRGIGKMAIANAQEDAAGDTLLKPTSEYPEPRHLLTRVNGRTTPGANPAALIVGPPREPLFGQPTPARRDGRPSP